MRGRIPLQRHHLSACDQTGHMLTDGISQEEVGVRFLNLRLRLIQGDVRVPVLALISRVKCCHIDGLL